MTPDTILLILAILLGFYVAWNIGANDVANAMGTSVGSGALTLKRAVLLAAVLELAGAFLLGSHVSETIEGGIVNADAFATEPRLYIYGMLAALFAAGVWLQIATFCGWPVSTTHSIVGALVGFGWVVAGSEAIYWGDTLFIFSSWIISPLLGGALAFIIFNLIRRKIFYSLEPIKAAKRLTPWFTFSVFTSLALVLCYGGMSDLNIFFGFWAAMGLSLAVGALAMLVSALLVARVPSPLHRAPKIEEPQSHFRPLTMARTNRPYELLEAENRTVERIFVYLQIVSACFMAFAHGANDVANAIGPLSAVVLFLSTGIINSNLPMPPWLLAIGGIGIVIGLATWGWRVIKTVGKRITELTPTRGFSAEFAAALTILIASRLGLPVSTTHTLVGAVFGVGLARGISAINLNVIRDILVSWIVTVPAGALLAILFYHVLFWFFG
ncbi:MAG: inorganic phosphate transporter [Verrucomicrobia bacterium]|nr:inorganic phosphate transporter [Verrucomicrobiota bacterium]